MEDGISAEIDDRIRAQPKVRINQVIAERVRTRVPHQYPGIHSGYNVVLDQLRLVYDIQSNPDGALERNVGAANDRVVADPRSAMGSRKEMDPCEIVVEHVVFDDVAIAAADIDTLNIMIVDVTIADRIVVLV